MKKIIIISALLLTSALYAQTLLNYGYGGEYNYSKVSQYDGNGNPFVNIFLPNELDGPAHSVSLGIKGEVSTLLSSGLTLGGELGATVGLSTKAMFDSYIHLAPVIGYSILGEKLMQFYFNPVILSLNPYYLEQEIDISFADSKLTQILDLKTGLTFSLNDMGLRNATAQGYAFGVNIKWGQVRFGSALKGFRSDFGFGLSVYKKDINFIFAD